MWFPARLRPLTVRAGPSSGKCRVKKREFWINVFKERDTSSERRQSNPDLPIPMPEAHQAQTRMHRALGSQAVITDQKSYLRKPYDQPMTTKQSITFYKMQGSGNDFVLLLNDSLQVPEKDMAEWARRICPRSFAVGADGLIFLEQRSRSGETQYQWHFFNADGSRAEMCGNGSRCAARLAFELGLAPASHAFDTDAGPVRAEVDPDTGLVKVQLTDYRDLQPHMELSLEGDHGLVTVHAVNTGVPHAVYIADKAEAVDLKALGPRVRYHERFAPAGANLNVIEAFNDGSLYVRTYERGVEAETFACGTGAAASAIVGRYLGLCGDSVAITTSGGERLWISFENGGTFLQGKAEHVYTGQLNAAAVNLPL